ncbi:Protein kinase domain-containing protein [Meloidogyne graminicola]|uniref:Protein kinase domain-containing protein n=1 Tax=Meloidogyne graminicola TaxID=189291 RepID=A0A8S9ZLC8_9BILA|nr:Protein kinase domain-containing protein [Meloidogyne graminicola]
MKPQGETVFKQANDAIGSGLIGTIYHAYWPSKNICVAIKVVFKNSNKKAAKNELKVLKVISSKPEEERNYLIYMYGYYLKPIYLFNQSTYMKIIMELGEKNLYDYFLEKNQELPISEENEQYQISAEREQLLTNIFKCSAKGVEQFHKIGIHMDIKVINFVVIKNINLEEQFKCKLIDFNSSIITNDDFKILKRFIGTIECLPQEFFDEADNYGGYKGCIQLNPYNRPSMTAIVRFLEDKCDGFIYEEGNYQSNRIC